MQIQHLVQNTPAWHAYRGQHDNASDAAAMMGVSPHQSRDALIAQLATGVQREFSDYVQRRILDKGHDFERLARPLAQAIIEEELFPVTACEDTGRLSASLDGLTMMEDTAWEHKRLNKRLREVLTQPGCTGKDLPMDYQIQMEQQCAVSGCERVLFMASEWDDDGHLFEDLHCWYTPNAELRSAIRAGWAQLHKDVAAYVPPEAKAAPAVGRAPDHLPALRIEVSGAVTASNLAEFKATALAAISGVNRELATDADFANAEASVKWCSEVESRLAAAKQHALSQTADIDALFRTMDDIASEARRVRLELDKLVKQRKEQMRGEAVAGGVTALRQHIAELHASVGKPWVQVPQANFGAVIKGMRSLESIRGAVNDELARCKIEADAQARRIVSNIRALDQAGHGFLFPDAQQLATAHDADTFAGLVQGRIAQPQAAEQARQDAERKRILAEVVARMGREQEARARAIAAEAAEQQFKELQAAQRAAELAEATERAAAVIAQAECPTNDALEHAHHDALTTGCGLVRMHSTGEAEHIAPEQFRDTGERINLSAINEHLAPISINAAGLAALGFEPVAMVKASKMYRASDLEHIRAALVRHLQGLSLQAA